MPCPVRENSYGGYARRSAVQFLPPVPMSATTAEDMAAYLMRLYSTLMTVGRCYTTDATGDGAALELGRVESVLCAFCTTFRSIAGRSPRREYLEQVTLWAEHMVKDHILKTVTNEPALSLRRPS